MKIFKLTLIVFIMLVSCKEKSTNSSKKNDEANFIISKNKVGDITSKTQKNTLIKQYKPNQIKETILYSYEEINIIGTEINTNKPKESLIIQWNKDLTPKTIKISNPLSLWKTKHGVKIGSTIKDVQNANEKIFTIYGYEIDRYLQGTVKKWYSGKLSGLNLQFEITKELPTKEYLKIMGDSGIRSDNPILEKAGLIVKSITVDFTKK